MTDKLPRYVTLACGASILGGLFLLKGDIDLSILYTDLSQDLLEQGADTPEDILTIAASLINGGLQDMAPTLSRMGEYWGKGIKREVPQLTSDNDLNEALSRINVATPKGQAS